MKARATFTNTHELKISTIKDRNHDNIEVKAYHKALNIDKIYHKTWETELKKLENIVIKDENQPETTELKLEIAFTISILMRNKSKKNNSQHKSNNI